MNKTLFHKADHVRIPAGNVLLHFCRHLQALKRDEMKSLPRGIFTALCCCSAMSRQRFGIDASALHVNIGARAHQCVQMLGKIQEEQRLRTRQQVSFFHQTSSSACSLALMALILVSGESGSAGRPFSQQRKSVRGRRHKGQSGRKNTTITKKKPLIFVKGDKVEFLKDQHIIIKLHAIIRAYY